MTVLLVCCQTLATLSLTHTLSPTPPSTPSTHYHSSHLTPIYHHPPHPSYYYQVTAMDHSIGLLLDTLRDLNIEENTIVVFTSDNGPENGAGALRLILSKLVIYIQC